MSWWDPIVDWFSGGGGDGFGDAVGNTVSGAGTALGGLFGGSSSTGSDGTTQAMSGGFGNGTSDYSTPGLSFGSDIPVNTTSLAGIDRASAGLFAGGGSGMTLPENSPVNTTSLAGINAASTGAGNTYSGMDTGAGYGTAETAPTSTGLLGTNYTKKDLGGFLKNYGAPMLQAAGALTNNQSPSQSTTHQQGQLDTSNALKSSVGTSMVNQAPFVAQNAENAAKLNSAGSWSNTAQRLAQQGYAPGSAQYESAKQEANTGGATAAGAAYAAGQDAGNKQSQTGATLSTPVMSNTLGSEQNAQQEANNKNKDALLSAGLSGLSTYLS